MDPPSSAPSLSLASSGWPSHLSASQRRRTSIMGGKRRENRAIHPQHMDNHRVTSLAYSQYQNKAGTHEWMHDESQRSIHVDTIKILQITSEENRKLQMLIKELEANIIPADKNVVKNVVEAYIPLDKNEKNYERLQKELDGEAEKLRLAVETVSVLETQLQESSLNIQRLKLENQNAVQETITSMQNDHQIEIDNLKEDHKDAESRWFSEKKRYIDERDALNIRCDGYKIAAEKAQELGNIAIIAKRAEEENELLKKQYKQMVDKNISMNENYSKLQDESTTIINQLRSRLEYVCNSIPASKLANAPIDPFCPDTNQSEFVQRMIREREMETIRLREDNEKLAMDIVEMKAMLLEKSTDIKRLAEHSFKQMLNRQRKQNSTRPLTASSASVLASSSSHRLNNNIINNNQGQGYGLVSPTSPRTKAILIGNLKKKKPNNSVSATRENVRSYSMGAGMDKVTRPQTVGSLGSRRSNNGSFIDKNNNDYTVSNINNIRSNSIGTKFHLDQTPKYKIRDDQTKNLMRAQKALARSGLKI